jgi:hypothetical protein
MQVRNTPVPVQSREILELRTITTGIILGDTTTGEEYFYWPTSGRYYRRGVLQYNILVPP